MNACVVRPRVTRLLVEVKRQRGLAVISAPLRSWISGTRTGFGSQLDAPPRLRRRLADESPSRAYGERTCRWPVRNLERPELVEGACPELVEGRKEVGTEGKRPLVSEPPEPVSGREGPEV